MKYFNNLDANANPLPGYEITPAPNHIRVAQPELALEIEDALLMALL